MAGDHGLVAAAAVPPAVHPQLGSRGDGGGHTGIRSRISAAAAAPAAAARGPG